jgi:ribosomal protein S27AE
MGFLKMGKHPIEKFRIKGNKFWKTKPDACPYCGFTDISGVEILGAYDGDLLWECGNCGEFLLRFTQKTTKKHLQKVEELHFNLDDWETIWQGLPN